MSRLLSNTDDLSALFGIEFEPVRTVPRALDCLIMALRRTPGDEARVLRAALERLEAISAPLSSHSAAALLRGFQIIGTRSKGMTARKLGLMAAALRSYVAETASDDEVIALWEAVIALVRSQNRQAWAPTISAWTQGLKTLRESMEERSFVDQQSSFANC